ncbi:hypothetical protein BKA70DRAFT_1445156 [Coprinopsis sp. MPI-PUGE-AT-0042]|nr:hypothetical protein BKA70DRAFT_1445156 [Coprinopsis sp. MPI-PUGE-AT-0042]
MMDFPYALFRAFPSAPAAPAAPLGHPQPAAAAAPAATAPQQDRAMTAIEAARVTWAQQVDARFHKTVLLAPPGPPSAPSQSRPTDAGCTSSEPHRSHRCSIPSPCLRCQATELRLASAHFQPIFQVPEHSRASGPDPKPSAIQDTFGIDFGSDIFKEILIQVSVHVRTANQAQSKSTDPDYGQWAVPWKTTAFITAEVVADSLKMLNINWTQREGSALLLDKVELRFANNFLLLVAQTLTLLKASTAKAQPAKPATPLIKAELYVDKLVLCRQHVYDSHTFIAQGKTKKVYEISIGSKLYIAKQFFYLGLDVMLLSTNNEKNLILEGHWLELMKWFWWEFEEEASEEVEYDMNTCTSICLSGG